MESSTSFGLDHSASRQCCDTPKLSLFNDKSEDVYDTNHSCLADCLCCILPSSEPSCPSPEESVLDVDEIYQVLGRDILKSSLLDDIDLYLECDEDSLYVVPHQPLSPAPSKVFVRITFPKREYADAPRYHCPVRECSFSATRPHLIMDHRYKEHGEKGLYGCQACTYSGNLKVHLLKHHRRKHPHLINDQKALDVKYPITTVNQTSVSPRGPNVSTIITHTTNYIQKKNRTEPQISKSYGGSACNDSLKVALGEKPSLPESSDGVSNSVMTKSGIEKNLEQKQSSTELDVHIRETSNNMDPAASKQKDNCGHEEEVGYNASVILTGVVKQLLKSYEVGKTKWRTVNIDGKEIEVSVGSVQHSQSDESVLNVGLGRGQLKEQKNDASQSEQQFNSENAGMNHSIEIGEMKATISGKHLLEDSGFIKSSDIGSVPLQNHAVPQQMFRSVHNVNDSDGQDQNCVDICISREKDRHHMNVDLSSESQTPKFQCSKCTYRTHARRLLRIHENQQHNLERETFSCPKCFQTFLQKRSLTAHLKKHSGELELTCDRCGRKFAGADHLRLHSKVHQQNTPYKCTYLECKKAFKTNGALQEHERGVHGVKNFICPIDSCGKAFTIKRKLASHMNVHSDHFICQESECRKQFRDSHALRMHQKVHTGQKELRCTVCNYTCIQKTSLNYHMKRKHPSHDQDIHLPNPFLL